MRSMYAVVLAVLVLGAGGDTALRAEEGEGLYPPIRPRVQAVLEEEWKHLDRSSIEAAPTGPPIGWSPMLTPVMPSEWPPHGNGALYYYGYARGIGAAADAERILAPWIRFTMRSVGSSAPIVKILPRGLRDLGLQGVHPVAAGEALTAEAKDDTERTLREIANVQGLDEDIDAPRVKQVYCGWARNNGVIAAELRLMHEGFFEWLACP